MFLSKQEPYHTDQTQQTSGYARIPGTLPSGAAAAGAQTRGTIRSCCRMIPTCAHRTLRNVDQLVAGFAEKVGLVCVFFSNRKKKCRNRPTFSTKNEKPTEPFSRSVHTQYVRVTVLCACVLLLSAHRHPVNPLHLVGC